MTPDRKSYRNTLDIVNYFITDEPEFSQMCFYMVGRAGFEPATLGLKDRYSSQLSYRPMSGPPGQIRTDTSLIKSQVRYH